MSAGEALAMAALRALEPERAHRAALAGLRAGLGPRWTPPASDRLATQAMGLRFAHPVGLAAGFDKNAEAVEPLFAAGFGFVEIGAVTPRPQPGNPRPRLFRLTRDRAVINRFGFNNDGAAAIRARLDRTPRTGPLGVNLGANKESPDRAGDYVAVLEALYDTADFFTVNVSSPNTERLRDLQGRAALDALLERVLAARDAHARRKPVLLKVAPDLSATEREDVAEICLSRGIDGIVATNTSSGLRDSLRDPQRFEQGGLSGAPIRDRATETLRALRRLTRGRIPMVGVGGIASAEDAYARIRAGAALVQLYTALVYRGPGLLREIVEGLDRLLERDGFATVAEAIGADAD